MDALRSTFLAVSLVTSCPAAELAAARPVAASGLIPSAPRSELQESQQPLPQPQQPKIDQVEPNGLGTRRFRSAVTPFAVRAEFGLGTLYVEAPRSTLHDRTAVRQLRLDIDAEPDLDSGVGLRLRAFATDDELFAGSLINDGVVPRPANTTATGARAFPHARWTAEAVGLDITARLGVAVDYMSLDHQDAAVERTWLTVGPRLAAEARLPLLRTDAGGLHLFGRVGGQLAYGWFHEEYAVGHNDDHMQQWSYDAGLGLRWQQGRATFDLGFEFGQDRFGGTVTELFGERSAVKTEQQMLFFGGSWTF